MLRIDYSVLGYLHHCILQLSANIPSTLQAVTACWDIHVAAR